MRESALMVTMMPVIHTLFPALLGTILASVLESAGFRANAKSGAKSGRRRAPVAAAERVRKSRRLVIFKPLFPRILSRAPRGDGKHRGEASFALSARSVNRDRGELEGEMEGARDGGPSRDSRSKSSVRRIPVTGRLSKLSVRSGIACGSLVRTFILNSSRSHLS